MSTPAVGSATQGSGTSNTQASLRPTGTRDIGQDAFLRLLTTQLQNQDPTKPQDNGEFIAQLATFSQLEKLTSISSKLDQIGTALGVTLTEPADTSGSTDGTTGSEGADKTSGSSSSTNNGTGSAGTGSTNGGK